MMFQKKSYDPGLKSLNHPHKTVYLPGLNGLRAIAAMAVVISHITLSLDDLGLNSKIFGSDLEGKAKGLDLAGNGVTIFFTLSGFLITFLLLKEKEISQIKVKDFYIRRMLRIWPLYYLYFILFLITAYIFNISYNYNYNAFYILLAANIPFILGKALPLVTHYWSLGVEEQFYLFFPHLAKISNNRLLKLSFWLTVTLLLLKLASWLLLKKYSIGLPLRIFTINRFHIMLFGVMAAILYYQPSKTFIFYTTHKFTQLLSWLCIFLIAINKFHISSLIDTELVAVISVFLIIGQVTRKNFVINLENKVCDFLGKISYGLYIIHPLLIFLFGKIIGRFNSGSLFNYLFAYVTIVTASILIAYISYEFYEKRFLSLKQKFTIVRSSSSKSGFDHAA